MSPMRQYFEVLIATVNTSVDGVVGQVVVNCVWVSLTGQVATFTELTQDTHARGETVLAVVNATVNACAVITLVINTSLTIRAAGHTCTTILKVREWAITSTRVLPCKQLIFMMFITLNAFMPFIKLSAW